MGELILFVVPVEGSELSEALTSRIRTELRGQLSPRHVPDRIISVEHIPRTLSGKKLEVPVKKILKGVPAEEALTRGALANPEAVDEFLAIASQFNGS